MAKYDALRKLERNQAVREYYAAHKGVSMKEAGKVFGISKQRVSKILATPPVVILDATKRE